MNKLIWAQAFPAGVADRAGRHALLADAAGRCALLRLADGELLWRSADVARPLLVDDEVAIALTLAPPRVRAWSLQGAELWRSATLPWPEWALMQPRLNSASDLHAGWIDGDVYISWQLRATRTGGAGRGPAYAPAASSAAAVRLCRASGAWVEAPQQMPDADAPDQGSASDDPAVLAQREIGGVRYALVRQAEGAGAGSASGGGTRMRTAVKALKAAKTLTAQTEQPATPPVDHLGAGDARWTCWLDDIEPRRPPPHRP